MEFQKVSERVRKAKPSMSIMLMVMIGVVTLVVILLITCLVLCCCRACYIKPKPQKNVIMPVNFQQPGISYVYK